jgi:chemotaxis regulatin CheY-phosphate phosphatase CheZ
VSDSVGQLVDMAKALSEGELEREFNHYCQGELGELASYLEAIRQTLLSLSGNALGSTDLTAKAADGVAAINREAESSFNSVWDVIERIQSDQAVVRSLLGETDGGLAVEQVNQLKQIAEKHQAELLALMSYLSFQDVLRQRLEKIQAIIGQVENKTLELMAQFKIKTSGMASKNGNAMDIPAGNAADLPSADSLDQALVDQLMAKLL